MTTTGRALLRRYTPERAEPRAEPTPAPLPRNPASTVSAPARKDLVVLPGGGQASEETFDLLGLPKEQAPTAALLGAKPIELPPRKRTLSATLVPSAFDETITGDMTADDDWFGDDPTMEEADEVAADDVQWPPPGVAERQQLVVFFGGLLAGLAVQVTAGWLAYTALWA